MKGGTQWVEWAMASVEDMVVAQAVEGDGAEGIRDHTKVLQPAHTDAPVPLKEFLAFLENKHQKVRMALIAHDLECSKEGQWKVTPKDKACLQVVTEVNPKRKRTPVLDNIAGFIDVSLFRAAEAESYPMVLHHHVFYWDKSNRILSDYPHLHPRFNFRIKQGEMYLLAGKAPGQIQT